METRANQPAFPASYSNTDDIREITFTDSLTKREYACIHNGIPETGDEVLDDIIRKGQRMKLSAHALQGILANPEVWKELTRQQITSSALSHADDLISALNNNPVKE